MPGLYDRIKDTWTITSATTLGVSSTFTVTGTAASGYETFAARYATNEGNIPVAIVSQTANQWMVCWCTYNPTGSTPNLLRIDTVIFSTSGDSSVTFSPATMDVFVTASSRAVPGLRENNTFTGTNNFTGTTSVPFTQSGAGAVARTVDAKLKEGAVSVKDFGAVGNGSTEDHVAIQAAIDYAASSGRTPVFFPAGTYIIGATITLKSKVVLEGESPNTTIIKAKNGLNADMLKTLNYATLTGQNKYLISDGLQYGFGLTNITLDGNKANQTSGNGLVVYGKKYWLDNIVIYNVKEIGWISEGWYNVNTSEFPNEPESVYKNVDVQYCGSHGIRYRGPTDAYWSAIFTHENLGWGVRFETDNATYNAASDCEHIHVYTNTLGGLFNNTKMRFGHVATESNYGEGLVEQGFATSYGYIESYINCRTTGTYAMTFSGGATEVSRLWNADGNQNKSGVLVTGSFVRISSGTLNGGVSPGVGLTLAGSQNHIEATVYGYKGVGGRGVVFGNAGVGLNTSTVNIQCYDNAIGYTVDTQGVRTQGMMSVHALAGQVVAGTAFDTNTGIDVKTLNTDTSASVSQKLAPVGTVAVPGFGFAGETNTGIYRPGANILGITSTGTEVARFINSGSTGFIAIGAANTFASPGGPFPLLQVNRNTAQAGFFAGCWQNSVAAAAQVVLAKSKSGTVNTHALVASGDVLGEIHFTGSGGASGFHPAARISAEVDGTPASNDMPGRLTFWTTLDGAASPTERMRINNAGFVGINTQTPALRLSVEDANSTGAAIFAKNTSTTQNFMGGVALGNSATANGFNVTIGTAVRDADTTDSYFAINKTNITTNAFVATLAYHDLTDNFWAFHTAGAERMRIDTNGRAIIGNPSAFTAASATYRTYFLGSGTDYPSLVGYTGNSTLGARISLAKSRNADWSTFAAVQDGDVLGDLSFIGADGSNFTEGARISGQVDGTIGASDMPGRLIFSTTPDGSSAAVERMRIDNAGNVGIGTSGALTDKFRVQGSAAVRYFSVLASGKTEIRHNNNLMEGDIFTVANNGISAAAHGAGIRFNLDISNGAGIESAYMRAVATDTYALAANRSAGLAFGTINAGTLAERFRIDGAGNIGIGTAVPGTVSGTTGANVIIFNSISGTPIVLSRNRTDDANASRWFWDKERNGLIVGNGDTLGTFFFRGYDGASFQPAASITAQTDGAPGAGDMPGRLIFSTTPDGTASLAERMRITNSGNVGIGISAPEERLHVAVPSPAGSSVNIARFDGNASYLNNFSIRSTNLTGCPGFAMQSWTQWTSARDVAQIRIDGLTTTAAYTTYGEIYFSAGNNTATGAPTSILFRVADGVNISAQTRLVLDPVGRLLVGHNASVESITGVATAKLQTSGIDATASEAVYRYSADTSGPMFILSKSRGSIGVSAAVSAGDELGAIHFAGAGATGFHRGASIQAIADTGATGAADMPGRLQFLTSSDGSATPTERLRITSTGDVVLMNDAGARDVSSLGFRGIPSNERSANYTLALTDAGKAVVKMITTAMTVTVPDNVAVPFPIGTTIMIDNSHPTAYSTTANIVTITPAADVGIVGAGAVKDQTTGTLPRFKNKTMNWPMQASLRKIRNKGSAVTLTTSPSAPALSTTVTVTMPSTNPYRPNDFIIIAGGTNTAYNGTYRVLTVSGLTLTYQTAAAPGTATGTYTATPADLWVITGDYGNSTTA